MPSATPLLKDLLSSQKANCYYYNKTQSRISSRNQYHHNDNDEVSQFEKYDDHLYQHHPNTPHDTFNNNHHLQNLFDNSLSRELLEKEEVIKEASLDLNKKFEEEMKLDTLNTLNTLNSYHKNSNLLNHSLLSKNEHDLQNPTNSTDSLAFLKSNEANIRPNPLRETGEFGNKQEKEKSNFALEDDHSTLRLSIIESNNKREYSPDIDRLTIKENKSNTKILKYISSIGSSAKWYKVVCIKDGHYFSVVRNIYHSTCVFNKMIEWRD